MTAKSTPPDTARPAAVFAQTDMRVHQAWAQLCVSKPRAAAVMHQLVSLLPRNQEAVVISHSALGKMLGCHARTVKRAIGDLEDANYLQVISLGKGAVSAYVINHLVAWTGPRERMSYASFSAQVIADLEDQTPHSLSIEKLNEVPVITPPDVALPSGDQGGGQMVMGEAVPVLEKQSEE